LQVLLFVQVSSSAFVTGLHVPVAHVWHVLEQVVLQQWESTQIPFAQSPPTEHICPCFLRQAPFALQVLLFVQVSSSAFVTVLHVPVVQVWHVLLQPLLQQWPSTHRLDAHSIPVMQPMPFGLVSAQVVPVQ
jgi:hypothetical protein